MKLRPSRKIRLLSRVLTSERSTFEQLERRQLLAGIPVAGGVPLLSSNTSASAKLYLDFDGTSAGAVFRGFNVPQTPAYDRDGDASTFSDSELADIREIWARVAEKFSSFNIDVTTKDPGSYADKSALKAVIGGDGAWTTKSYGGFADVGSFYSSALVNTIYVFSRNLSSNKFVGEEASRQAGAAFGLNWQSRYGADGYPQYPYNPGNSLIAPVMGYSYSSTRGLWWNGTNSNYWASGDGTILHEMQDDMAIISGTSNGFGYRADGSHNSTSSATAISGSASGIIEKSGDVDYFSFATGGGSVTISLKGAQYGQMLDPKFTLLNSSGQQVGSADTASLNETGSFTLSAGTYYIAVSGHGMIYLGSTQGSGADVGQYSLTVTGGTGTGTTTVPAAPSSLSATAASSSQINLAWTDNSSNESGFTIDRATNSSFTGAVTASVGSNVRTYSATGLSSSTTYYFRVRATNSAGSSANSNTASASTPAQTTTTVPAAPSALSAVVASSSQINLSWTDNSSNESAFIIDRATNSSFTGATSVSVGVNVRNYSATGLASGTAYYFRVRATNSAGASANSNTASATTSTTSVAAPAPPGSLTATGSSGVVVVDWIDQSNNETGFTVQRSTNGGSTWSNIGSVGTNVSVFNGASLISGVTYTYRVYASGSGGNSGYSNTASILPIPAAPTGLVATALSSSQIKLTWNDVSGETSYSIWRQAPGSTWMAAGTVSAGTGTRTFTDSGLQAATTYTYKVSATGVAGSSGVSNVAYAQTLSGAPTAPSNVSKIYSTSAKSTTISWRDNSTNETGFVLQYSLNGSTWTQLSTVPANTTSYVHAGVKPGTTYYYRVAAYNSSGQSAYASA